MKLRETNKLNEISDAEKVGEINKIGKHIFGFNDRVTKSGKYTKKCGREAVHIVFENTPQQLH